MRHLNSGYKLRRNPSHRKALLRNLTQSLIERDRIETTLAKAKAVRPIVEKMVTMGKSGSLAAKRRAMAYLYKRDAVHRLFNDVAPRFMDRPGGYTRILRTDFRRGDGAEMAVIEFVDHQFEVKKKPKDKGKTKGKRA
ncbi:MAG: 50S ribosomal protein L17 [Acidobacteriota bacterium]|jgi:large subunit ribosomal protein L17|nr:50S ribosomal protein L17 [Acidobacteriota bacterium]